MVTAETTRGRTPGWVTFDRYRWNMADLDDDSLKVWGPDSYETPEMRLRQEMLREIGRLHGESGRTDAPGQGPCGSFLEARRVAIAAALDGSHGVTSRVG